MDRTWARISRANPTHPVAAMAMKMVTMPLPRTDTRMMLNRNPGNAYITSVNRISRLSTTPPAYPATAPIRPPIATEITAAPNATARAV